MMPEWMNSKVLSYHTLVDPLSYKAITYQLPTLVGRTSQDVESPPLTHKRPEDQERAIVSSLSDREEIRRILGHIKYVIQLFLFS